MFSTAAGFIPYNLGRSFYASRPNWYIDGDNANGESDKAHKAAFNTDFSFNIADFFAFGSRLLKKLRVVDLIQRHYSQGG